MRTWLIRLGIALAVIVTLALAWRALFAPEPIEVTVTEVDSGNVEQTISNSRAGTVQARRRAKLSPEIGGQVAALPFREGETVASGDVVLKLDASTQAAGLTLRESELEAAQAEENRARVATARAERELARIRRLADEKIVSVDLLDQATSSYEATVAAHRSAKAQASRARAAVVLAQTEISKTVLRAPFDGLIAELTVEVGEWTTPSPPAMPIPAVLDILDPSSIYVTAPVDEVDSATVRAGMTVRITVDSHRGQELRGTITRVAPYVRDIQEQNRTVEVEAEFDDREFAARLLPGTSADLEIIVRTQENVLRIPTSALLEGGRAFVLEAGHIHERRIETGIRNWNYTEILSGVSAGESVVVSLDQSGIEDGVEAEAAEPDVADSRSGAEDGT